MRELQEARKYDQRIIAVAHAVGAELIDPYALMCGASLCEVFTEQGAPIYMDDSHLRASYVRKNARFVDALLRYPDALSAK